MSTPQGRDKRANGIDDDHNGFIDDWRGWDFVDGDNTPTDESTFPHGTAVSGPIAARGSDGFGVSGVAPRVSLLELRAAQRDGSLLTPTSSAPSHTQYGPAQRS